LYVTTKGKYDRKYFVDQGAVSFRVQCQKSMNIMITMPQT